MDHVCVLLIKGVKQWQCFSIESVLGIQWNRTLLISLVMNEASLSQSHTNFHLSAAEQRARRRQNNAGKKNPGTVAELSVVFQYSNYSNIQLRPHAGVTPLILC